MKMKLSTKLIATYLAVALVPLILIGGLGLRSLKSFSNEVTDMTGDRLNANAVKALAEGALRDHDRIVGFVQKIEDDTLKLANSGTLISYLGALSGESTVYNRFTRNLCDEILRGFMDAAGIQSSATGQTLKASLALADRMMRDMGNFNQSDETIAWNAINQFSREEQSVRLPAVRIGDTAIAQNFEAAIATPLVDDIAQCTGGAVTLFQRMNDTGDMLRAATSVIGADGRRAAGTFIPATNPDGQSNAVIASVLKGETFNGRAFVVNEWYLTAYQPIQDAQGKVVGVLFVGLPEQSGALVKSLVTTRIGESGYQPGVKVAKTA